MKHGIRRSFKTRIFVTVLLVALLPLIACVGVMTPLVVQRSKLNLAQQADASLRQVARVLRQTDAALRGAADELSRSQALVAAMSQNEDQDIYPELFSATAGTQAYAHFGVYDAKGVCRYAVNGAGMTALEPDWGVLRAANQTSDLVYRVSDDGRLLAAQALPDAQGQTVGYAVFALTDDSFATLLAGLYDAADNVLLLDERWRLVYHSQAVHGETVAQLLRQELLSGEPLSGGSDEFAFYTARVGAFTVVLQQPTVFTQSVLSAFYLVTGVTATLCLALCFWSAWVLSRHLSQPVNDLSAAMGEVERGEFDVRLATKREDELGRLAGSFNHMVAEYKDYLDRSVQRQKELNDAQLRMMQAQLNPHFLYNTLDSVKWMAVTSGERQIADLATDLADLLRAAISADEFITLEKELELVERYVEIQLVRFGDRFTCEVDAPERYRSCLLPKLVLQPIVENAIIHGVAEREDGYIKLTATEQGGDLLIFVCDNGCGMPQALVEQLNAGDLHIAGGHLGLNNVNSILRLHYGPQYGISASATENEGSRVCLRLPLERKGGQAC